MLAAAGYGSRRQCEELIEAGRVEVDGNNVTKLGTTVDPLTCKVKVDGVLLRKQKLVYYAVNKPVGVVTTNSDPQGRPRVIDLVPNSERVFSVGRLDRSSEGLILLTNDGDLAQQLAHPKYGVRKTYRVTVAGKVDGETMKQMRQGIFIAEGRVKVEGAKILKSRSRATELEIILREGKNREIRRILARLGHKVQHLRRIAIGPLRLGDLPTGAYHTLTRTEIRKLQDVGEQREESEQQRTSPKRRGQPKRTGKSKSAPQPTRASKSRTGKTADRSRGQFPSLSLEGSSRVGAVIGADASDGDGSRPAKRKPKPAKRGVKKSSAARKPRGAKKTSKRTKPKPAPRRGAGRASTKASSKKRPARKRKRS